MGRIDKVNSQVKREIGRIIQQELSDPRVQFVTITQADVSRDLRSARIRYSVLGDQTQMQAAQNGLDAARGLIRKLLASSIKLRNVPELLFIFDETIEASIRIEETLKEIHDKHEENNPGNPTE